MAYDVGVDLGTTYTCAALVRDGHLEVCQLGRAALPIPSIVSVRDDGIVVTGEAAERRSITDPAATARDFKRRFGDAVPFVLGGVPYGAEALTGRLLERVLAHITQMEGAGPQRVALTHPANYGPFKLDLLRDAARLANVADPLLIAEPVAAAVAYGARASVSNGDHLLVYDLGGGTFDAAVVGMSAEGPGLVGAPEGLDRFGGVDLDEAVLAHVDSALGGVVRNLDSGDPSTRAELARLRDACRAAKEALSDETDTEIPVMLASAHTAVRLTRAEFEAMVAPRLEDTIAILQRVVTSAGLTFADIATVLLVGGSSRIPLVAQVVRERTGRPVAVDANPKFLIASGAAMVAASQSATDVPIPQAAPAVPETPPLPAPLPAPPATPTEPPLQPKRTRRRLRWAVAAIALAIAGTISAFLFLGDDEPSASPPETTVPTETTLANGTTTSVATGPAPLGTSTLLFGRAGPDGAPDLLLVDVDGGAVRPLVEEAGFDGFPAVSPDRRRVVYSHSPDAQAAAGSLELRIVNADGTGARTLATDVAADAWPAWSPDGSAIVFPVDEAGAIDLYVLDLETEDRRRLTSDPEKDSDPTWSPDGDTIAFTHGPDTNEDIRAVAADGESAARTIVTSSGSDGNGAFAPVGDRLAFTSTREGNQQLFVAAADGTDARRLLDRTDEPQFDPRWAPDGTQLAVIVVEGGAPHLVLVGADGSGSRDVTPSGFTGLLAW